MNTFKVTAQTFGKSFVEDPRPGEVAIYSFVAGAKFAAAPVQRLGEIIQKYAPNLPPPVVKELREIFALNKEIVDE